MQFLTSPSAWLTFRSALLAHPGELRELTLQAEAARQAARLTVVDKKNLRPGEDPHDYSSQGPYWWPDPASPDGLPYIRHDGQTNPEFHGSDRQTLEDFCERVTSLVLHAWATGDTASAATAGRLLRVWFVDHETRMNPNLNHAQRIPGICEGRGIGIIDTNYLCFLIDQIGMLPLNEDWSAAHLDEVKRWFSDYLDWLLDSTHGRDECREHNNHGTWYDAQVACFAVFCGRTEVARSHIEEFTRARIASQIATDGSQPHELSRALALHYCTFNLIGFVVLAQAARRVGINLWSWQPEGCAGLHAAIAWLIPFYREERPWTWSQIAPFNRRNARFLMNIAAQATDDARFATISRELSGHARDAVSLPAAASPHSDSRQ